MWKIGQEQNFHYVILYIYIYIYIWDRSVCIGTVYRLDDRGSILGKGQEVFLYSVAPRPALEQPIEVASWGWAARFHFPARAIIFPIATAASPVRPIYSTSTLRTGDFLRGQDGLSVILHLVPMLRLPVCLPPLRLQAFVSWCIDMGTDLPLPVYFWGKAE
jgi:hypothetical protein